MQFSNSFNSIEQLMKFEPGRTYLWDLAFAFKPFNSSHNMKRLTNLPKRVPDDIRAWIPADSMSTTSAIVNSADITVGQTGFRFPSGTTPKEITINFIDDYKSSIRDWLKTWMEDIILCSGKGVNWLSESVDILTITELLPTGSTYYHVDYYVYPDGPLSPQFTSDSGLKVYSVNFVVAGVIKDSKTQAGFGPSNFYPM